MKGEVQEANGCEPRRQPRLVSIGSDWLVANPKLGVLSPVGSAGPELIVVVGGAAANSWMRLLPKPTT